MYIRLSVDGLTLCFDSHISFKYCYIYCYTNTTSRLKGRTAEVLTANTALDGISHTLNSIYRKFEDDESLSMAKIRTFYCGKSRSTEFLPVFDSFIDDIKQRVGKTISKDSLQKYNVLRRHFFEFLNHRYARKDIGLTELTPAIIQDLLKKLSTEFQVDKHSKHFTSWQQVVAS